MDEKEKTRDCLKGGCTWPEKCSKCGFNRREAARRKLLPLELGADGLWCKKPRKTEVLREKKVAPTKETRQDARTRAATEAQRRFRMKGVDKP